MDSKEFKNAVVELRELVEKGNENTAEYKEKLAKIEKDLDSQEEKNQKLLADLEKVNADKKEFEDRVLGLEKKMSAPGGVDDKAEVKAELKAFEKFMQKGQVSLDEAERKFMRTDVNTDGGFLAPDEYLKEILKNVTEYSPVRNFARVYKMSAGSLVIPTRESLVTSYWANQGQTVAPNNSKYGQLKIEAHRLTSVVDLTNEMLNDSAFDMVNEIGVDVAEDQAQKEGTAFLLGNGTGQPQGIIPNVSNILTSGTVGDFTADDIIDLTAKIKSGYKPMFGINKVNIAKIRKMKDPATGAYLWIPGLADGTPNTILGYSYAEMPDMTVGHATGDLPILFGDFRKGYIVADRMALGVVRDNVSQQNRGIVRIVIHRYVGGAVTRKEAFTVLKVQ